MNWKTRKELEDRIGHNAELIAEKKKKLAELKSKQSEKIRRIEAQTELAKSQTKLMERRLSQIRAAMPTALLLDSLTGQAREDFHLANREQIKTELAAARKILGGLKAEGIELALPSKTPHLDHYDKLTGGEKTTYYRQHKREIRRELQAELRAESNNR